MILKVILIVGALYYLYRVKKRKSRQEEYLRRREREIRREVEDKMKKKYKK